ncbi:hypothetical protein L21SP3_01586 [Sedimentisphaera cyanobacteriorum]|uniref:Uncharacterized protein n=1 Tax=Sedimentisphaera cyanobacteriorum TaxID=1940790 RepID=A0A1Q2HRB7_9BACT|nr:hypothetical protein [Sedimentisphaera cyanobacteriorum]AQQ09773.1 hypothetical protein L21SP3_01586 [Sedimentisphaera cyanobacteriorum]
MKNCICIILLALFAGGCGAFRLAPGEVQKQNAHLLGRTIGLAEKQAEAEGSERIKALAGLAAKQHSAVAEYMGKPKQPANAPNYDSLKKNMAGKIAEEAGLQASAGTAGYSLFDPLVNIVIALFGIFGGAGAAKAAAAASVVRKKLKALEEIVKGNEVMKKNQPHTKIPFSEAQVGQSKSTKQIVRQVKDEAG